MSTPERRGEVDVAAVRASHPLADIVAASGVELTPRGHGYIGCCPFHEDHTPSFSVDGVPDRFHCFGCGASGDVIAYVQRLEGLNFLDAVHRLTGGQTPAAATAPSRPRPPVPVIRPWSTSPERVHRINDLAWSYFTADPALSRAETYLRHHRRIDVTALRQDCDGAPVAGYARREWRGLTEYLGAQGVTVEELLDADLSRRTHEGQLIDTHLGRLIVPIRNAQARIDGFIGRDTTGDPRAPKYRNPTRTPTFDKSIALYRPAHTDLRPDATVVVVEGALDALAIAAAAAQVGQSARFAPCTTSGVTVSAAQATQVLGIHPRPPVIALDGDEAGADGTLRWLEQVCLHHQRPALVTSMPPEYDPADWIAEHGPAGLRAFDRGCTLMPHVDDLQPYLPGRQLVQLARRGHTDPVGATVAVLAPLLPQLPPSIADRLLAACETEMVFINRQVYDRFTAMAASRFAAPPPADASVTAPSTAPTGPEPAHPCPARPELT